MATFSENQVRQLYVATALKGADKHLVPSDNLGTIEVLPGSAEKAGDTMYFEYKSHDGIVRSDIINTLDIVSVTRTLATDMETKLKKITVTSEAPVEGEIYILKIIIRNFIGMSDADSYAIIGEYKAKPKDSVDKLYAGLAKSLNMNMPKCCAPLVKVKANSSTSLTVEEVEQPWTLGKFAQERVYFDVIATPVKDENWITKEVSYDAGTINNGKQIADLEWFCKGNRADIYRVGYPDNFEYLGVANPATAYDVIDVVYNYVGNNEDVQKSRKVISIAIDHSNADTLLGRIEAGAGLTDPVPGA